MRIHGPKLGIFRDEKDNHVEIPTPQIVAAGVPVEVSVGAVTKSHLWRRD